MAIQTTMKSVKENYDFIVKIPYADLQYLLTYTPKTAYTAGVYGWNASVYDMSCVGYAGVAIVTGYRPFGNVSPERAFYKAYENRARAIIEDRNICYPESKTRVLDILKDFVKTIVDN